MSSEPHNLEAAAGLKGLFDLDLPIADTTPRFPRRRSLTEVVRLCEQYRRWFGADKISRIKESEPRCGVEFEL